MLFFFQHPFINRELDSKPVRDLLLEYKAEVVEEEVVDEDAEVRISCFVSSNKGLSVNEFRAKSLLEMRSCINCWLQVRRIVQW